MKVNEKLSAIGKVGNCGAEGIVHQLLNKDVAVGAGAKINQTIQEDSYALETWKEEPDSVVRIYFVLKSELEHWKSFGLRDFEGVKDGFLNNIPVA